MTAYEIIHIFSWEVVHPLYTAINQGFDHWIIVGQASDEISSQMKDVFF